MRDLCELKEKYAERAEERDGLKGEIGKLKLELEKLL